MTEYPRPTLISLRARHALSKRGRRTYAHHDTGMDPNRIAFSSKAVNNWFEILGYVGRIEKVDPIIARALVESPEHQGLKRARPCPAAGR
jgi:hypothetical protein